MRSEIEELAIVNAPVPFSVANTNVVLYGASTSGGCLNADRLTWQLPDILGGTEVWMNNLTNICEAEAIITLDNDIYLQFGNGSNKASFTVTRMTLRKSGDELILKLVGFIGIRVGGQSANAIGYIELRSGDQVTGNINSFNFTLVGFSAGVRNATVNNGTFTADSVSLGYSWPGSDDGISGNMENLTFTPPDELDFDAVQVNIGQMTIGGFNLPALSARLERRNSSYQISVNGSMQIPGFPSAGELTGRRGLDQRCFGCVQAL